MLTINTIPLFSGLINQLLLYSQQSNACAVVYAGCSYHCRIDHVLNKKGDHQIFHLMIATLCMQCSVY